jgi:hypothetical protein
VLDKMHIECEVLLLPVNSAMVCGALIKQQIK